MKRGRETQLVESHSAFILKTVSVAAICSNCSVSPFTLHQMCKSEDAHSIYFNAFVNKLNNRNTGNNGEHGNKTLLTLPDSH